MSELSDVSRIPDAFWAQRATRDVRGRLGYASRQSMRELSLLGAVLVALGCGPALRDSATTGAGTSGAKAESSSAPRPQSALGGAGPLRGTNGGRLSVGELFVEELQLLGETREFSATVTLTGVPALVKLGALEASPRWRDADAAPEARVEGERPLRFEGTTGCLTLLTTRDVYTPELALKSGSMFHRVRHDPVSDLCVGCYVHHGDWMPGDRLECGAAFTEVCGLAIPCDALEGAPEEPEDTDAWLDLPDSWAYAQFRETDDEEGILDVRIVSPMSGRTYVVLRANGLYFGSPRPELGGSGVVFAPGLRLAARVHPSRLEPLPDSLAVGFGGGCDGDHGRGLCGGHVKKDPELLSARLDPGTQFHDANGRAWATVASPLVVQYGSSTAEGGLVNVRSRELDGICEHDEHCSCGSDLFYVQASDLRPMPNDATSR